jgi:hypothetical protein
MVENLGVRRVQREEYDARVMTTVQPTTTLIATYTLPQAKAKGRRSFVLDVLCGAGIANLRHLALPRLLGIRVPSFRIGCSALHIPSSRQV